MIYPKTVNMCICMHMCGDLIRIEVNCVSRQGGRPIVQYL